MTDHFSLSPAEAPDCPSVISQNGPLGPSWGLNKIIPQTSPIRKGAMFCSSCGFRFEDESPRICPDCGAREEDRENNYCPECGSKSNGKKVCPECGCKLERE